MFFCKFFCQKESVLTYFTYLWSIADFDRYGSKGVKESVKKGNFFDKNLLSSNFD